MELLLSQEDFSLLLDDDALYNELTRLVDGACPASRSNAIWSGRRPELIVIPEEKPRSGNKARRIISAVLFYGLLATLIAAAFFISQGNKRPVFGYSFMNVITWSMEPDIPQGSLVIVRQADPGTIQIGDDIAFMRDPETSVTHRVIGIVENHEGRGERGFETQGINNDSPDFDIVPAVNVAGVVKLSVPRVGNWLEWLRANLILVSCFAAGIVVLALLLKGAFKKSPAEKKGKPSPLITV